jgi:hypothetical protein
MYSYRFLSAEMEPTCHDVTTTSLEDGEDQRKQGSTDPI